MSRGTRTESNTISLLLFTLDVPTARWVALVGLGTALACAGALVILLGSRNAPAGGLPTHLQTGPGLSIVHARGLSGARGPVIDVTSVHDLAKVALRDGGGIILQETRPGYEGYFVQVGAVLYRYVAMDTAPKVRRGEAAA